MRRCGWTRCRRCCASLDEPTVALLRERVGVETDAGVKKEIETGLALAALDGTDPKARLAGDRARCSRSVSQDVRNRLALPARKIAGRHASPRATTNVRQAAAAAVQTHRSLAHVLLRHRDAVFRPEPGLGAGADRHRPGDHVRRHGRHQHGARRADDARRVHDLRRADG